MPEGDVVLRTARRLHAALAGHPLITSDFRWPSLATVDLTGHEVTEVIAVGKHLLIRLTGPDPVTNATPDSPTVHRPCSRTVGSPQTHLLYGNTGDATPQPALPYPNRAGVTVHSHLRMEGSWHVHRTGERWVGGRPEHGIRVILANRDWTAIGHRLGLLDLVPTSAEHTLIGHLGPDILAPDWELDVGTARVAAHPDRAVGEALLDQRLIAGIGTFFMSEACFLRGVNPWRPVGDVPDLRALVQMAHRLMTANLERAVQVTTGDARRGQEQWVHSRSGRPCRRCRTPIRVAQLGRPPTQRVAFWCPSCQPGAVPTDTGARQRPLGASRRAPAAAKYRRP